MIIIDKNSKTPIYTQIYTQLSSQIKEGYIANGDRLTATRVLAKNINVSRHTVEKAYDLLIREGYVTSLQGSGYIVKNNIYTPKNKILPSSPSSRQRDKQIRYDMSNSCTDSDLVNTQWRKCMTDAIDVLQSMEISDFSQRQGESILLELISVKLSIYRGYTVEPYQIILTSGTHYCYDLVAGTLNKEEYTVLCEDPSNNIVKYCFSRFGYDIEYLPMESDGISTEELYKYNKCILCLTPDHQFPTGARLSSQKREKILQWAEETDSYIFEDEYDSAISYLPEANPSIAFYDKNDRVIHIGSFLYLLIPGMRISYVVLPKRLYPVYDWLFNGYSNSVPLVCQYAMVEYISEKGLDRYFRKFVTHYNKKRNTLLSCLEKAFGDKIDILGENFGLFITVSIKNDMSEAQLVESASQKSIKVYPLSPYEKKHHSDIPRIILGYGPISEKHIPKIVELLKEAWLKNGNT